jgi:adenylate kinase family enzyme
MVKIRICGGAGSGKTTLAKHLSKKYRIPRYDLDEIFFADGSDYSKFRDEEERDRRIRKILKQKNWIIEGTYTKGWALPTFKEADKVIYISAPLFIRQYRVVKRWVGGKLGLHDRKEGTLLQLLELLHYEIGHKKRHIPRLEKMKLGEKLIVIRKIEEYR